MRWSEIAPNLSAWLIPASRAKNGAAHVVHLSEPARAIIRELASRPRLVAKGGKASDFVLTTTGTTSVSGFSWDANTVTHILGVRAFGTQLLCDQVVGRALRRQSYELDADGLFPVEYADILGIPFDFAAKPVVAKPMTPKPTTRVRATKDREALEIAFPRVEGERLRAEFSDDSRLVLTPEEVGPCTVLMEGIVGKGVERTAAELDAIRPSTIVFGVAKKGTQIRKMPLCSSRIG